jgi:putative FmdB family regulatory protein
MPTYEFRCPDGHEFERFYRKMSDATPEVACPECGKLASRLLSGGAGLVFKGSGFYLTDYGKNAHRKTDGAANAGKGDAKAEGGSEAKSESKASDAKSGDSKSDSKAGDSKGQAGAGPSKSAESKSSETKPSSSTKSDK